MGEYLESKSRERVELPEARARRHEIVRVIAGDGESLAGNARAAMERTTREPVASREADRAKPKQNR